MKVLDLNAYGVSEMNQQELMEIEGGIILTKAVVITLAALYLAGTCAGLAGGHKFGGMP